MGEQRIFMCFMRRRVPVLTGWKQVIHFIRSNENQWSVLGRFSLNKGNNTQRWPVLWIKHDHNISNDNSMDLFAIRSNIIFLHALFLSLGKHKINSLSRFFMRLRFGVVRLYRSRNCTLQHYPVNLECTLETTT